MGEVFVQFSRGKVERFAVHFRFAIVMKFLRQRSSLDRIRVFRFLSSLLFLSNSLSYSHSPLSHPTLPSSKPSKPTLASSSTALPLMLSSWVMTFFLVLLLPHRPPWLPERFCL
ncbi:hypothetical protein CIPAW_10G034600 [Carya illinoinensis]|uniref:Uncharacterized protein n=1 Tax=Carya illinoinensis TaxID=32201 RepID=A0A8T1PBQ9_CARIL|nr:hypothetical protein CIPAW_10G034600 [Carya illinoinensis]KAG6690872.1 hypothetical protein I3842_10G034000 [Carya illinoinensis]